MAMHCGFIGTIKHNLFTFWNHLLNWILIDFSFRKIKNQQRKLTESSQSLMDLGKVHTSLSEKLTETTVQQQYLQEKVEKLESELTVLLQEIKDIPFKVESLMHKTSDQTDWYLSVPNSPPFFFNNYFNMFGFKFAHFNSIEFLLF